MLHRHTPSFCYNNWLRIRERGYQTSLQSFACQLYKKPSFQQSYGKALLFFDIKKVRVRFTRLIRLMSYEFLPSSYRPYYYNMSGGRLTARSVLCISKYAYDARTL